MTGSCRSPIVGSPSAFVGLFPSVGLCPSPLDAHPTVTAPTWRDVEVFAGQRVTLGAMGYFFRCQNACRCSTSSFAPHVIHVVLWRPKKKVMRVYARWVVAMMADECAIREFSNVQLIGDTVGQKFFTATTADRPVAVHAKRPRPEPTATVGFDRVFLVESFTDRFFWAASRTTETTVSTAHFAPVKATVCHVLPSVEVSDWLCLAAGDACFHTTKPTIVAIRKANGKRWS